MRGCLIAERKTKSPVSVTTVEEQNLKRGTGDLVVYEKPEQNDGKEKSGKNDRKGMYKKHWRYVRRRNKVKRKGRTRTETPNEGVGRLQSGGER